MLTGQNGILNRATDAKKQTEDATDLEFLQTKAYEAITNYYVQGQTGSENEYILEELKKVDGVTTDVFQGTVKYNGKTYYISDIIGNTNEQKAIEKEKSLTQITAANATDSEDKMILESTDSDGNAKIRMIIVEETTNNGKVKAVIPSGFYYVTGKPSTGLVISDKFDDDDNNSKCGNQFVWVPCNGSEGVVYEKKIGLAKTWTDNYSSKQLWYTNYQSGTDSDGKAIYSPIKGSWSDNGGNIKSVDTYGGFYVARYEAGVPSNAPFYIESNGYKYEADDNKRNTDKYIPVSKKNNQCWNFISQENASIVSANMYKNSKVVISQLVDSYAWDTIIEWMKKEDETFVMSESTSKGNYLNNETITDVTNGLYAYHLSVGDKKNGSTATKSSYWSLATKYQTGIFEPGRTIIRHRGNGTDDAPEINRWDKISNYEFNESAYDTQNYASFYIYKELATGASEKTKVRNIYDMAGNMWEWTTETGNPDGTSTIQSVLRGGSFVHNGLNYPVSSRNGRFVGNALYIDFGFRVVLYIQ